MSLVVMRAWLLTYFICLGLRNISTARIGIMGSPHMSHYIYLRNIASQLVALDHNVSIVVPEYIAAIVGDDVPRMNKILFHSYTEEDFKKQMDLVVKNVYNREHQLSPTMIQNMRHMSEAILRDEHLFKDLQNQNFDLFIVDATVIVRILTILPYRLGVPFIAVGVDFSPWTLSIPYLPSFVPHLPFTLTDKMVLTEKMLNVLVSLVTAMANPFTERNDVAVFAPEMPFMSVDRVAGRAQLWISDTNEILDYAKPTMPNVKQIGGLGLVPPKQLSGKLQQFMDTGESVVLVTFGSLFPLDPNHTKELQKAFRLLPFKIVWRIDDVSLESDHIYTSNWILQNDVLAHNNTKLFVTHCGNAGQFEALYHGVPMLGLPLFAEQHYNAARMVSKGYGIALDYLSVTSDQLVTTINELITNTTYKRNIKQASEVYRSQMRGELPSATAAFWIDHVIKHGGAYMRSAGQDMVWYEYLLLDVMFIFLVILYVFIKLIRIVYCLMLRMSGKIKQD